MVDFDDNRAKALYTTAMNAAENLENGHIEGAYDAFISIADAVYMEFDKQGRSDELFE